jgi:ZIP family zinc transporter
MLSTPVVAQLLATPAATVAGMLAGVRDAAVVLAGVRDAAVVLAGVRDAAVVLQTNGIGVTPANLSFVFIAGLITALATGLGAIPFFLVSDISERWNVILWGVASGIMVAASVFGLITEGLAPGIAFMTSPFGLPAFDTRLYMLPGLVVGVLMVIGGHRIVHDFDLDPKQYEQADFSKLLLILGVLTVHSFPEGIAVGVAFAEMGLDTATAVPILGFAVPVLGVFMTIAISIHNIPEGVAISIPLESMGVPNWRKVWWAVFSSLPQPIGAVIAFGFVRLAKEFLPFGFGLAAGAMIYLVVTHFIPEALEEGEALPQGGRRELTAGVLFGVGVMIPLVFV